MEMWMWVKVKKYVEKLIGEVYKYKLKSTKQIKLVVNKNKGGVLLLYSSLWGYFK